MKHQSLSELLKPIRYLLICLILFSACSESEVIILDADLDSALEKAIREHPAIGSKNALILPMHWDHSNIPSDPQNKINHYKVKLGGFLFHDTSLGLAPKHDDNMMTYSCASCHHQQGGFQACMPQGIGDGGLGFGMTGEGRVKSDLYESSELDVQPIRTPSILNVAYQEAMLWNGQFGATGINAGTEGAWTEDTPKEVNHLGFEGVETQAIAGLDVHRLVIDPDKISEIAEYVSLFNSAFPEEEEQINTVNAGLAIAAYERTVLSYEAPFQRWLRGEAEAMSEEEKEGALLFFTKGECADCHNCPALNSMEFYAYGMKDLSSEIAHNIIEDDPVRLGRGAFTGEESDNYAFKVPQLYNLKDSPFYGHGASFTSIKDVVAYKNIAISENDIVPEDALTDAFKPLGLSDTEIDLISVFIMNALYDDNLERYVPESVPSNQCFPNADLESMIDLDCT